MSLYEFLLFVHVLAVVLWVGGGTTLHVLGRRVKRAGDPERRLAFARDATWVGNRLYAPLAVVLVIGGVLLVVEGGYEFSELWITLGFTGWTISLVLGIGFYARQERKLDELAAREGAAAPATERAIDRVQTVNALEVLMLVLVIADMVVKPGA